MDNLTCRHCGVTCMRFEAGEGGVRHPANDCHYSDWEFSGRLWKDAAATPSQDSQEVGGLPPKEYLLSAISCIHAKRQQKAIWLIEKAIAALPQSPKGGAATDLEAAFRAGYDDGYEDGSDRSTSFRSAKERNPDTAWTNHLRAHPLEAGGGPATPAAPSPDLISQIHSLCVQSNAREGNPLATSILAAIEAGASGAGDQGREWIIWPGLDQGPETPEAWEARKKSAPMIETEGATRVREVVEAPRGGAA